jgi:hypothetical protein
VVAERQWKRLPRIQEQGRQVCRSIHTQFNSRNEHVYNPSSSSLITSSVRAGNEVLTDDGLPPPRTFKTCFDFLRAGVSTPSSSVSTFADYVSASSVPAWAEVPE